MSEQRSINGDGRLEALRQREVNLKAAISRELLKEQKRKAREDTRLFSICGEVLVRNAEKHPDFELLLKNVLQSASSLGDSERKLLRRKGWL